MYKGDRSRKETLVAHGFRLPSALDNRPLQFEEFSEMLSRVIFVSATPGDYEVAQSKDVVQQVIRPTGLLDPLVELRKSSTQVDDCLHEIRIRAKREERVLVTVLTKRMAQELADYYTEVGVRARYLHSDIDTIERMEILTDLRAGKFDVLIGINLLREGLDLPEVSLVAIMDADRSGFLRNRRSLIQTIGRAARNADGTVILYGEVLTDAIAESMAETAQRRELQIAHNTAQNITPTTIIREVKSPLEGLLAKDEKMTAKQKRKLAAEAMANSLNIDPATLPSVLKALRKQMKSHAGKLEFEKAADLRDRIHAIEANALGMTD
jgi:excinuclease ABC subunit B